MTDEVSNSTTRYSNLEQDFEAVRLDQGDISAVNPEALVARLSVLSLIERTTALRLQEGCDAARELRVPWSQIAAATSVTRQAAHQRWHVRRAADKLYMDDREADIG